ncbi:MAG: cell division protein FtsA [Bacteroidales bacterium]
MNKHYTAAVDIGSSRIRVAVAKIDELNAVKLLGYAEEGVEGVINSEVLHLRDVGDSIQRAVCRIEEKIGGSISSAFVNVGGRKFITKCFKFDKLVGESGVISESDVKYLDNEVRNVKISSEYSIYDVCSVKYIVDGEKIVKDPIQMAGRKLEAEYTVIIGPKDYSRNIQHVFKELNIEILKLSVDTVATSKVYISADDMEAGAILLDMGKGTTKCTVYVDGRIKLMYSVPFGGDAVTQDIQRGLNISYRNAEKLKIENACSKIDTTEEDKFITISQGGGWNPKEISSKNLSNIVEARVEEILEFLNSRFLELGVHENIGSGIIVVGGGARLKGVLELIAYNLGLQVKFGVPAFKIEKRAVNVLNHPQSASLSGLIALKLGIIGDVGDADINSDDDVRATQGGVKGLLKNIWDKIIE